MTAVAEIFSQRELDYSIFIARTMYHMLRSDPPSSLHATPASDTAGVLI
jgi:hypothetical protein